MSQPFIPPTNVDEVLKALKGESKPRYIPQTIGEFVMYDEFRHHTSDEYEQMKTGEFKE